jgi:cysteine-rich repeat protein
MRTTLVPAFISILLGACIAGEISGPGGGDDEGGGAACGDNVVDSGEACDDGNTLDGDGCSATCSTEATPMPRIMASVDKTEVTTELGKNEIVTLDIQSIEGFAGSVTIAASLVDAANAPIPGITVDGPTTLGLAVDGTVSGMYAIQVASNATGTALTGSLKLDLTTMVGTESLTSTISVTPTYTITYAAGTGATAGNHPVLGGTQPAEVTVKRGTTIKYINSDTIQHDTHGGGIFDHQNTGGGQPGTTYEQPTIGAAPGSTGVLGCHENGHGGGNGYVTFTVE